jgi:CheY-like chemotaxis protein
MSSKRALVVDDSKSARAFLARILERHEIAVDAAESAEAAIDYLTRNRPDVIFMDHMMPGMDGFQAVQTIKNNPRTSAIPILMYTSQEGDLYLGQARALGAEGVLPKQIKQADVTKMLYQLRLVSDRRGGEQTTFRSVGPAADLLPANESGIIAAPRFEVGTTAAHSAMAVAPPVDVTTVRGSRNCSRDVDGNPCRADLVAAEEIASLRSFIGTTLDSHSAPAGRSVRATARDPRTRDRYAGDGARAAPGRRSSAGRWRDRVGGVGGDVLAVVAAGREEPPRCAPISPQPTPKSKPCAPGRK